MNRQCRALIFQLMVFHWNWNEWVFKGLNYKTTSQPPTWWIWKKARKSARELMTMERSWMDMRAATQEKNSSTSSVESPSLGGTRCCQHSCWSMNSLAHVGIQLGTEWEGYARTDDWHSFLFSFILLKEWMKMYIRCKTKSKENNACPQ